MLVLTRKADEQILIGENVKITIVKVRGNSVRLGIEAPREIRVVRGELDPLPSINAPPKQVTATETESSSSNNEAKTMPKKPHRKAKSRVPHSVHSKFAPTHAVKNQSSTDRHQRTSTGSQSSDVVPKNGNCEQTRSSPLGQRPINRLKTIASNQRDSNAASNDTRKTTASEHSNHDEQSKEELIPRTLLVGRIKKTFASQQPTQGPLSRYLGN